MMMLSVRMMVMMTMVIVMTPSVLMTTMVVLTTMVMAPENDNDDTQCPCLCYELISCLIRGFATARRWSKGSGLLPFPLTWSSTLPG